MGDYYIHNRCQSEDSNCGYAEFNQEASHSLKLEVDEGLVEYAKQ